MIGFGIIINYFDFVEDHALFFVDRFFFKDWIFDDISHDLHCTRKVLLGNENVIEGTLMRRGSIKLATDGFNCIGDFVSCSGRGAFKQEMLDEMRHPSLLWRFVD